MVKDNLKHTFFSIKKKKISFTVNHDYYSGNSMTVDSKDIDSIGDDYVQLQGLIIPFTSIRSIILNV